MAKQKQITRTIQTTEVFVLALNVVTAEPENISVKLAGVYKDKAALLKAAKRVAETDELKLVEVVGSTINNDLYAMDMNDFVNHAHKIVK